MRSKSTARKLATTMVILPLYFSLICCITAQRSSISLGSRVIDKSSTTSDKKKRRLFPIFPSADAAKPLYDEESQDGEFDFFGLVSALVLASVALVINKESFPMTDEQTHCKQKKSSGDVSIKNSKMCRSSLTAYANVHGDEATDAQTGLSDKNFLHSCDVGFEDVKLTLQQKGKDVDKRDILDGSFKGIAQSGRMLAIMGPSGSGKSSLMNAIAGKVKQSNKISLSGKRYVNNEALTPDSQLPAAYIEQETSFFPHLTVKETLDFHVELKLGDKLGKSARDDIVTDLMQLLGLEKSSNTIVGDAKVRGLSGGERKRLSIACEMISSPPVIILDEPTTGLDSYQAAQVVYFLRKLADSGKTILAVIHQPSQQVFSMFDDLLLVSEGRQMYFGEVKQVRSHFEKLGYPCARDVGTAEHILECISPDEGNGEEQKEESKKRLDVLAEGAVASNSGVILGDYPSNGKANNIKFAIGDRLNRKVNIFKQFRLLFSRAFKQIMRGRASFIIKLVQQVVMSIIYGGIYKLGDNQASVMDRMGLFSLVTISAMNIALASTVRTFTKEKTIISGELSSGMYGTLPYFIAKAISELPLVAFLNSVFSGIIYPLTGLQKGRFKNFFAISTLQTMAAQSMGLLLGAISPSSDVALSLFGPVVVLNIIFDGRNLSDENTPKVLRGLSKCGIIRHALAGLAINEFDGLTFTTKDRRGPIVHTGYDALEKFGFSDRTVPDVIQVLSTTISSYWFLSYLGLSLTKQKFEPMVTP